MRNLGTRKEEEGKGQAREARDEGGLQGEEESQEGRLGALA